MRSTSRPRAATSVATRTSSAPVRSRSTIFSRSVWATSPEMYAAEMPRSISALPTSSAAPRVRTKTIAASAGGHGEDAGERAGLVTVRHDGVGLPDARHRGRLARDGDLDRAVEVLLGDPADLRRHRGGEQGDLALAGRWRRAPCRRPRRSPCAASRRPRRARGSGRRPSSACGGRGGRGRGRGCRRRPARRGPARAAAGGTASRRTRRARSGRAGASRTTGWRRRPAWRARASGSARPPGRPAGRSRSAASSGRPNAAVLPVPVWATPTMSRPLSSAGTAWDWMADGDGEAEVGDRGLEGRRAGRGRRRWRQRESEGRGSEGAEDRAELMKWGTDHRGAEP